MAKIRLSVSLFTCKRCGVDYNNRVKHVCVVRWQDLSTPASMRKKKR
jgi:hypothetical protein